MSEQRLAGFRPSPGAAHAQAVPPTQASLGATGPTLEISGGVHKVPGLGPGTRKPSLHRTGRRVFPRTILCSRSPTHIESECPGKTWAPGAGAGGRPRFHAKWRWTGRPCHRPLEEFSLGTQACATSVAKSLPWAPKAPPCPEAANQDPAASILSSLSKTTPQGSETAATRVPQSCNPLPVKAFAASCPWCPQMAFTCPEPGPMAAAWGSPRSH